MKSKKKYFFYSNIFDSRLSVIGRAIGLYMHVNVAYIPSKSSYFYTVWNMLVAEQIVVLSCSCTADVRNCSYLSGTDDTVVALVSD